MQSHVRVTQCLLSGTKLLRCVINDMKNVVSHENTQQMITHFSDSPSNKDSRGLVSLRMMCIEELKLRVKLRVMATVRRAVSFRLTSEPVEFNIK